MTNIKQLLLDYEISFSEQDEWIQVQCPYCISATTGKKKHGGFNLKQKYYHCWKCGWHELRKIISDLLNISQTQAKIILKKYRGDTFSEDDLEEITKQPFQLPDHCKEMTDRHRKYLELRNFDSYKLEREWGLLGTNHHGDYRLRIIAPITLNNKIVSYQGRDITGLSKLRYKACKMNTELIHYKHIVYGFDKLKETKHKDRCIITEGITDVWRLGVGVVATFGIGFTSQQILFLAKNEIKLAFIMFDPEDQAQQQAEKLSCQLTGFGIETKIVDISKENVKDPGELSDKRASEISKELLK